jgi:type IV pilus biogenesis protein CpaD/CtpE
MTGRVRQVTAMTSTAKRTARLAAALAAGLAIAGCVGPTEGPETAQITNDGAQAHFDVAFQPGGGRLASGEVQRLRTFLSGLELRPEDDIFLYPGWTGSERIDGQRAAAMRAALPRVPTRVFVTGRTGFERSAPRSDTGLVRVVRYDTLRVACPRNEQPDVMPNIGCANAVNLASQATDMRGLTVPDPLSSSAATLPSAMVLRERAGQTPPVSLGNSSTGTGG